ncbi:mitochondrial carrier domain-containing protein [Limtongia smithiae]|uniref:mitochondrial carrier domain-containing protein n=1 Tax=Limtongia smithiae TaxID=1125753 RepID=UPI0034CF07F4
MASTTDSAEALTPPAAPRASTRTERRNKMLGDMAGTSVAGPTDALQLQTLHPPSSSGDVPLRREYNTALSAGLSSLVSTFVGFPFDSVKTRMQAYKFRSVLDCVAITKKTEGMSGFFRGVGAPMISVTIVRTLSFSIYAQCRNTYTDALNAVAGRKYIVDATGTDEPLTAAQAATPGRNLLRALPVYFLSGFTAGGFIAMFSCPFEFTKLSTQIELLMARAAQAALPDSDPAAKYEPKGTLESFKDIIRRRGILGLYSGFRYHFARDAIGTSLYFTVYESSKQLFTMYSPSKSEPGPLVIAASGGLCGIFSWAILFPVDTMKSIVQRDILTRAPGTPPKHREFTLFNPRMYRGLGVSIARTGLVNMTFFSIYEPLFRHLSTFTEPALLRP